MRVERTRLLPLPLFFYLPWVLPWCIDGALYQALQPDDCVSIIPYHPSGTYIHLNVIPIRNGMTQHTPNSRAIHGESSTYIEV